MRKIIYSLLPLLFLISCTPVQKSTPVDPHTLVFDKENLKYKDCGNDFSGSMVYQRYNGANGIVGDWRATSYEPNTNRQMASGSYTFKPDGFLTFSETHYIPEYFHREGVGKYTLFTENGVVKVKMETVTKPSNISDTYTVILNVNFYNLCFTRNR